MAKENQKAENQEKESASAKPKLVKMVHVETQREADVHPEMVQEYEKGGYHKK